MRPLALDRRTVDANGHMNVSGCNISKANICPYRAEEIPDWQRLGLTPGKVYHLYRDAGELAKAAASFANKPLLIKHVAISADEPARDLWVGVIGAPVTFDAPYLKAPIAVWTAEAIALIESGTQEQLSAAYRFEVDMRAGVLPSGERYDGRMINLAGNHVALVEQGRAGPDVVVGDSAMPSRAPMPPLIDSNGQAVSLVGGRMYRLGRDLSKPPASPQAERIRANVARIRIR